MSKLELNTTSLRTILNTVHNLPNAGVESMKGSLQWLI